MPTYVYRREDGTTFEVFQSISEEPLTIDPETGQKVQRVITGAGIIFKGEGFYLTDYARKNGNGNAAAPKVTKSTTSEESSKPAGDSKTGSSTSADS